MFELLGYNTHHVVTKVQLWDRLVFVLSMAGLVLMPNNVRNVKHERSRMTFALNDNSRLIIAYERKISFDTHLEGEVDVCDWFNIKSGGKTEIEELSDDDNIVRQILFYDSKRIGNGGKGRKDLVSLSEFNPLSLHDYETSESFVRLKTLQMMKDAGMRGRPNGYSKRGTQLHYALKIEHTHREILKKYKPKYTMLQSFKQIKEEKEIWKLTKKLLHQKQISILRESSRLQVVV